MNFKGGLFRRSLQDMGKIPRLDFLRTSNKDPAPSQLNFLPSLLSPILIRKTLTSLAETLQIWPEAWSLFMTIPKSLICEAPRVILMRTLGDAE